MSAPLLIRAAELLEELAADLMESHTCDGVWVLEDEFTRHAHAEYQELVDIARQLREREEADIRFAQTLSQAFNSGDGSYRP